LDDVQRDGGGTGTSMTLWLDGRTISGTAAKVGDFDSVTVTCEGGVVPPVLNGKRQGTNLVISWATNVAGYNLMSSTTLGVDAIWSTVSPSPVW